MNPAPRVKNKADLAILMNAQTLSSVQRFIRVIRFGFPCVGQAHLQFLKR